MDAWVFEAGDYHHAADILEQVAPDHCHPDLYRVRREVAAILRRLAEAPESLAHQRYLNTVEFFCYALRPRSDTRVK